ARRAIYAAHAGKHSVYAANGHTAATHSRTGKRAAADAIRRRSVRRDSRLRSCQRLAIIKITRLRREAPQTGDLFSGLFYALNLEGDLAAGRVDLYFVAALMADQRFTDRALCRELAVARVRFRRSDNLIRLVDVAADFLNRHF